MIPEKEIIATLIDLGIVVHGESNHCYSIDGIYRSMLDKLQIQVITPKYPPRPLELIASVTGVFAEEIFEFSENNIKLLLYSIDDIDINSIRRFGNKISAITEILELDIGTAVNMTADEHVELIRNLYKEALKSFPNGVFAQMGEMLANNEDQSDLAKLSNYDPTLLLNDEASLLGEIANREVTDVPEDYSAIM